MMRPCCAGRTESTKAYEHCPGGLDLDLRPQTIGRAHTMVLLERYLDHVADHDDVGFRPLSQAFDAWIVDSTT